MFLSDVSIRRPVTATIMNVVLIVFGLFSLPRLAIDQMPDVDFPVVTISVLYPGADPETVEQRILEPLEQAVNSIGGLDKISSTAYPSLGQIVLQFKLEKNGDQAAQAVRDKVSAAVGLLPDEAEAPIVQKFDIGGAPILNIAVSGDGIGYDKLSAFAKDDVEKMLQRIDGVATVNSAGIREREVQIKVDRDRLAGFGLTPQDVMQAVQQQNLDMPAGRVKQEATYQTLRVKGRLSNAAQIAALPITKAGGGTMRVGDVATVEDTIAEETTAAFIGKTPTILMSLQKQAGSNTPAVAAAAIKALEKLKERTPQGVKIEVVTDNSKYIKGSIDSVKLDLVLGAALATFIVLVFLRHFWITVISAVALPTAVIATFAFLQSMGFTLNMMTTLGLSLSIGILIDDAIIVVENIARHLAMGKDGPRAAKDAVDEIGLAVVATTATICAVFVPVAFMEGIIGRFFYQFGLTVAFAVAVSLFVAFTLTPMLSARLLKADAGGHHVPLLAVPSAMIERFLVGIESAYKRILIWCLGHRAITLALGVATFVLSIVLLRFVPVSFFPKEDRSQFNIAYTLPEGTTLEESKKRAFQLVEALQEYPGVDKVVTAIAATREAKPNKLRLDVLLVPKDKRSFSQADFMVRVRDDLAKRFSDGGKAEFLVQDNDGGGGGGRSQPIQLILTSDDWEALSKYADEVKTFVANEVPGAVDVATTKPKSQREFRIEVDASRAADLAVSSAQVGGVLRALFEGDKISEVQEAGKTYDVRMRIADKDRVRPEDIAAVTITNRRGEQISLGSLAQIRESEAPSAIERYDGQRQIVVLANFTGKDLRGATEAIKKKVAATIPPQIGSNLSGQAEIMEKSINAMLRALATAVLLVFMVMCAQYERYLAPLVIMAALPLSLAGAFGSLLITGQVMSIYSMIGIILLMGIVTKNGILLIDFALQRINQGASVMAALLEAGPIRLRPILMTTFAAGGGMLPIAIGHGEGGEARSPMGVAVIGGLLMSTFLTLVVVPCLFSAVEGGRERFKNRRWLRFGGAPEHELPPRAAS